MKVAILGGGPSGAFAAAQLASNGIETVVFDEKLAWEKPCGGGLTCKAYSQYPFLAEGETPKKVIRQTVLSAPKSKAVTLSLDHPLLIYSRYDLNGMLLDRAQRAGAQLEKTRILNIERTGSRWSLRTKSGDIGRRLLHRRDRRAQPIAKRWHRADFERRDERSRLLHSRRSGSHRHSVSAEAGRVYLGISALRPPVGGNLRQGPARIGTARPARTLHGRAGPLEGWRDFLQPSSAVPRYSRMETKSGFRRWLAGNRRCRGSGGSHHRRRPLLRGALGRPCHQSHPLGIDRSRRSRLSQVTAARLHGGSRIRFASGGPRVPRERSSEDRSPAAWCSSRVSAPNSAV